MVFDHFDRWNVVFFNFVPEQGRWEDCARRTRRVVVFRKALVFFLELSSCGFGEMKSSCVGIVRSDGAERQINN